MFGCSGYWLSHKPQSKVLTCAPMFSYVLINGIQYIYIAEFAHLYRYIQVTLTSIFSFPEAIYIEEAAAGALRRMIYREDNLLLTFNIQDQHC